MSLLFQPIQFGRLKLDNRIIIAPMCQYSSEDGDLSFGMSNNGQVMLYQARDYVLLKQQQ